MDDVELAIHDAWQRVRPILLADEAELARRLARRRNAGLGRPPRAWCMAVRASDTRIPDQNCRQAKAIGEAVAEEVRLDARLLRTLCAPVTITPPGETLQEVAAKLGVGVTSLLTARARGIFRTHHIKGLGGSRGWPVPLLYTDRLLDPSAKLFACADRVWSWTAPDLGGRIVDDFEQAVTRVAYWRGHCGKNEYAEGRHPEIDATTPKRRRRPEELHVPRAGPDLVWYKWKGDQYLGYDWRNELARENYERQARARERRLARYRERRANGELPRGASRSGGSLHFNGWQWVCPACGKTCRTIYCPAPRVRLVWDVPALARVIDIVPPRGGIEGFACVRCHRVQYLTSTTAQCWNIVVSYLSEALLYGAEVARPAWFARTRQRAYAPRFHAKESRRRPQVIELLIAGLTHRQIGERLGLSPRTIDAHVRKIYEVHGVHRRRS